VIQTNREVDAALATMTARATELAEELGLQLDTDPAADAPPASSAPAPAASTDDPADEGDDPEDTAAPAARVVPMRTHA
jgi:hypothetical protein